MTTAVATTARATAASVITTAVAGLSGVHVYDHDPAPGVALGNTAVVVTHAGRERFVDRYAVIVEIDPAVFPAAEVTDRIEQVVETVDLGLESGLTSSWQTGPWGLGFVPDVGLWVARCELQLFTDDPHPEQSNMVV